MLTFVFRSLNTDSGHRCFHDISRTRPLDFLQVGIGIALYHPPSVGKWVWKRHESDALVLTGQIIDHFGIGDRCIPGMLFAVVDGGPRCVDVNVKYSDAPANFRGESGHGLDTGGDLTLCSDA